MAVKPAALKLPKSIGACVDLYHDKREERLAVDKKSKEMKGEEVQLVDHIIANVSKKDEGGAVGKRYKAVVYTDPSYVVDDWEAFYKYLRKTGNFQFLNRAINQAAVKEFVEEQKPARPKRGWKPKLPPGMTTFNAVKLSVTKI